MSTGKFIAGCVVGGVIGAIAGLLLAPQSGEETREAIKDVSRDVADKTDKKVKEIQEKAAKRIKERSESENVIVDTHCTINTPSGFLPGLPIWVLNELQPNLFVMIEANPDEIIYRRLNDDTRSRDIERAKDIQLHQEMNRAASMAYATLTGATVKIIENHDNHLPSTVSKLVDVLNK